MGIFAVAALAGFLLFGWINASQQVRAFFLKPWVQLVLGLLALGVLMGSVCVLITLPTLEFVQIAQDLTGPEVLRLILGVAFGCLLRYWGPHFWTIRMRPGTRYNWVAISLVGLLLLAATVPYINSLLRDWGVTGLKTPFAELQITGKNRAVFSMKERRIYFLIWLPHFKDIKKSIEDDRNYLKILGEEISGIEDSSDKKEREKKISELDEKYKATQAIIKNILIPLGTCAKRAQQNGLDTESIRDVLRPVAQKLRLSIKQGQSQNPASLEKLSIDNLLTKIKESVNRLRKAFLQNKDLSLKEIEEAEKNVNLLKETLIRNKDPLRSEVKKSLALLKEAIGKEKEECALKLQSGEEKKKLSDDPGFLANAPHIYLTLAELDGFNDNREESIAILKQAFKQFGDDRDLSPGIFFNINFFLAHFLYSREHDPESIFRHLDKALKIVQDTLDSIDKQKQLTTDRSKLAELRKAEKRFKTRERWTKDFLASFSAELRVRKFKALLYAEENYENIQKLDPWMKPQSIDTYGYVKMAFAAQKVPPDFDEIQQAKALFEEAKTSVEIENEGLNSYTKHELKKMIRSHIQQADRLLASR